MTISKQLEELRGRAKQFPHISRVIKKSGDKQQDIINYVRVFIKLAKQVKVKKEEDLYELHRHLFRMSSKLFGVMFRTEHHGRFQSVFRQLLEVRNICWRKYQRLQDRK